MGTHVEWIGAAESGVGLVTEGQGWDGATGEGVEDAVDPGNVALVIGIDTVSVIEGTESELRRLVERMTEALDSLHPLPELPEPAATEDEEEATCPYVYTQADADAVVAYNAEYTAKMRAMHGDDANLYPQPVPEVGAVCGGYLMLWDKDPVRRYLYVQGGHWVAGPSSGADDGGGDEEVNCSNMHYWAVPEIDEWQ